jgi:hypothetical protein
VLQADARVPVYVHCVYTFLHTSRIINSTAPGQHYDYTAPYRDSFKFTQHHTAYFLELHEWSRSENRVWCVQVVAAAV